MEEEKDDDRTRKQHPLTDTDDEKDMIESPRKIQQIYASQRQKSTSSEYSEVFSYVLLRECFMVVVKVDMAGKNHSGYSYDLEIGLIRNDETLRELNLYGPYKRVSSTGGPIPERSTIPNSKAFYDAQCYVMIPKVDQHGRYGPRTLKEQVQELANYCNQNYRQNLIKRRNDAKKTYTIVERTFGLAPDPLTEDTRGHLSDYLVRDNCVTHLTMGHNFDVTFYSQHEELAKQLLQAPYSVQEQDLLGYPAPEQQL